VSDTDLASIAETRRLIERASAAQARLIEFEQADVDRVCAAMAEEGFRAAAALARQAVDETGIGRYEDKIIKNEFATRTVWEAIREMRTVGFIHDDQVNRVYEVAVPVGVLAGLVPTTNPTSTAMFKAIISLKARNAIVFSPHPRATKCTAAAAKLMNDAAVRAGAPDGVVSCIEHPTMEATDELMRHRLVAAILATGGSAMVRAAYSSGKPAYGVGPGNVPAFISRSADVAAAVACILKSKSFDNGTICASEQAIVTETAIEQKVIAELIAQGAYMCDERARDALQRVVMQPHGGVNPAVVGKSALEVAVMAGLDVPPGTRVLVARLNGVGKAHPLSAEKLCPVLAFYVESDWEAACLRCIELLNYGGLGHSLAIHCKDEAVIREFALKKPVNRILVNTPSSHGAIGFSTGLLPSLTLGCGSWGGNITSDNVGPLHLINRKRVAYDIGRIAATPEYVAARAQSQEGRRARLSGAEAEALRRLDRAAITRLVDSYLSK
jgi:acetaldehyde dehydrogenase (acetylating)